jgi:hypothetical protein
LVIRKVLLGAAIAFGAALGAAAPAGADPSSFGTLGCSCTPTVTVPGGKAPGGDEIDQGIKNGLAWLHGVPSRSSNF